MLLEGLHRAEELQPAVDHELNGGHDADHEHRDRY